MKARALRRLASFLVAMFVASNVAAAARACIDGLSGPADAPLLVSEAVQDLHACPDALDAAGDHAHCKDSHKNDDPKSLKDVPPAAVCQPPLSFTRVSPHGSGDVATPEPPAPSGPSLTLLFGNLRL